MDEELGKKLRMQLLAERDELQALARSAQDASATVTLDQTRVGRLSRMDALQGQQMALEAVRRRELRLRRIQAALQRIGTDDYGYCLECGEDMDPRRLAVAPAAERCIACAESQTLP